MAAREEATQRQCPDLGACHHNCMGRACFRVEGCEPLSGHGESWTPEDIRVDERRALAEKVVEELYGDDRTTYLGGPLGEVIAELAGSCSLEFVTPEQLAEGIAAWLTATQGEAD